MRSSVFGAALATLWIGAAVACATANDEGDPPGEDGGPAVVPDALAPEGGVDAGEAPDADASGGGLLCSTAGWCRVPVADENLAMIDLWPLAGRAFALAKSPFLGVKVLEWDGAASKWAYIDDDTQNEAAENGMVRDPSTIWAPNDDEVYYAVTSATSGYVYHGKRPAPPATAWTWSRSRFAGCSYAKLWVYGTGGNDVYAGVCNAIYRKGSGVDADGGVTDAGAPEGWVADYVESDPASNASFLGASGSGPSDVWFAGGRKSTRGLECGLVVHRTATGYERIVDSTLDNTAYRCVAKEGSISAGAQLHFVQQTGRDRVVAFSLAQTPMRITAGPDGGYVSAIGKPALTITGGWNSAWVASEDELWLARNNVTGQVLRATAIWDDAGTYQLSSIALNGSPTLAPILRIRGTSNTNLWAVGGNYVFHKTSP